MTIFGVGSANVSRLYKVTSALIVWDHIHYDLCVNEFLP